MENSYLEDGKWYWKAERGKLKQHLRGNNTLLSAFTLPEVIVSFGVLIMVVVAATNLMVNIIRGNQQNQNTLLAYGLAQEALEGFRNIRDSNWLLGADFQGKIDGVCVWSEACLPLAIGKKHYFIIDRNIDLDKTNDRLRVSELPLYAPWKLFSMPVLDFAKMQLYIDKSAGFARYVHVFPNLSAELEQSIFKRYVEVVPLDGSLVPGVPQPQNQGSDTLRVLKYQVFAVVKWREGSREKEVRLGTELADWKGGPV